MFYSNVEKHHAFFPDLVQTSSFSVRHEKIKSYFKTSPFTRDSLFLWLMNRAAPFCLRGFSFSKHYAQIGSSLLAAAGRRPP